MELLGKINDLPASVQNFILAKPDLYVSHSIYKNSSGRTCYHLLLTGAFFNDAFASFFRDYDWVIVDNSMIFSKK